MSLMMLCAVSPVAAVASEHSSEGVDPKGVIFHHLGDQYGWAVPFSHHHNIPLPIIVIDEEAKSAKSRIDKFLADIGWKNITFECIYYNDILEDISSSQYYSEFKQRYFL